MEEHSEWDFAKHFSKFNKKKAPIGSRVQEGDALLSDTEAIMSPKKPVVSAGCISAGTGGVQSIVQLDAKVDKVLEAVNDMQARVLSLALAHSLSHVQTMEYVAPPPTKEAPQKPDEEGSETKAQEELQKATTNENKSHRKLLGSISNEYD